MCFTRVIYIRKVYVNYSLHIFITSIYLRNNLNYILDFSKNPLQWINILVMLFGCSFPKEQRLSKTLKIFVEFFKV